MLASVAVRTKSPEAFRTISEVSADLDVPQHVLRFWEGRFAQIKPVKRAGGRRYYRPDDVDLLRGISTLLYGDGFTIKGVQKILRDKGARHVADLGRGEFSAPSAPIIRILDIRASAPSNVIALERPIELPVAADVGDAETTRTLAEEETVRLEILLAELLQLKARFLKVRARD